MLEDQVHSTTMAAIRSSSTALLQADVAWAMERAQLLSVGLKPTDRVLDVGCGPGHLSVASPSWSPKAPSSGSTPIRTC